MESPITFKYAVREVGDVLDPASDALIYGHISDWDTSQVTDMSWLFYGKREFNDDISQWDVGRVGNMSHMFSHASAFNQPLDNWNVSRVEDMNCMFRGATAFNQPLDRLSRNWNVSRVSLVLLTTRAH